MKTKYIMVLVIAMLLTTSCSKKEDDNGLHALLQSYANKVFDNEQWMKGGVKSGTYTVTLDEIKTKLNMDVTPFEDKKCNMKKTKIDFIVSEQTEAEKTNYKYNIVLDCKKR